MASNELMDGCGSGDVGSNADEIPHLFFNTFNMPEVVPDVKLVDCGCILSYLNDTREWKV